MKLAVPFSWTLLLIISLAMPLSAMDEATTAQIGWWSDRTQVTVEGTLSSPAALSSSIELSVGFQAGLGGEAYEALRIYVEGSLILEQINNALPSDVPEAQDLGHSRNVDESREATPYIVTHGSLNHTYHRFTAPLSTVGATLPLWLSVRFVWEGAEYTAAETLIYPGNFGFTTTFRGPRGGVFLRAEWQHCCSNQRCGDVCTNCKGPFFFCDLIACTIECISY